MYKILVVDDAQENINILNAALRGKYKVAAAKDGVKAILVAKKIMPDLILLDIVMPNMDGYAVIQALKSDDKLKDIPVIFITAQSTLGEKTMGFELGAVDYITKPFEVSEVNARVETHLALMQSKKDVQDMLSKTLVGAINVFMEIEKNSHPMLYNLSNNLRKIADGMAKVLDYPELWMVDVGALLSLSGLLYMNEESLRSLFRGNSISKKDIDYYNEFPEHSAVLISKIPRLESVSEMVRLLNADLEGSIYRRDDRVISGAQILQAALKYELSKLRGLDANYTLKTMRIEKGKYPNEVVEALEWVINNQ